jgi:IS5 family transposase
MDGLKNSGICMKPKSNLPQGELFRTQLSEIINPQHPLIVLAGQIDWSRFDAEIDACYANEIGRPGINTRVMVGLLYLKETYNESDASLLKRWVENVYWQAFCGFRYMEHEPPIDSSTLTRWRNRVGAERLEILLKVAIETAVKMKALNPDDFKQVNVDTTVQEKAIAFPTDSRLYQKMRLALVRRAKQLNLKLKQTYKKEGKEALIKHGNYTKAKQFNRAKKMEKKLKTLLSRVISMVRKLAPQKDGQFEDVKLRELLQLADRLMSQTKTSKNKVYSVHEPEVQCICKGKVHKRYEFGRKVSVVTANKSNWVLAIQAIDENPYDGHTLNSSITQMERVTGATPKEVVVDKGYQGHDYKGEAKVHVVKRISRSLAKPLRKLLKRRSAIEPVIGHLKSDHRMDRNYLRGVAGDKTNAILAGVGFNLRKLLRWVIFWLNYWLRAWELVAIDRLVGVNQTGLNRM